DMTSSFGMRSHQATLQEDVTLLNAQTSSSLTGRTSGLPLGQLLGDAAAVSAMLDRLLHHGHPLKCGPRSWRTKMDLPAEPAAG
ncbi:MAG: ATP-binding protein, partial [Terriglobia bacterium]